MNKLINKIKMLFKMGAILFACAVTAAYADADASQFDQWLKENGQMQQAQQPTLNQTNNKVNKINKESEGNKEAKEIKEPKEPKETKEPVVTIVNDQNQDVPVISPPLTYTQSEEVMLKSAPAAPAPSAEATDAFNAMIQQNTPLTPQQVVKFRQLMDQSQRAAAISPTVPPKPVSSTIMINLAPGATPPAIRLAQKHVTSLVFIDSAGSPWPIASYDLGDSKAMSPQWDGKSNILLIQALSPYDNSDLVIRLVGLNTPITLELVPGQRVVDARTDIHVPGLGPNSKDLPTGTNLPQQANQLLLDVLGGIAPAGSKALVVKGGDCQAWVLNDKMYLRSRLTLLSPGWTGRMTSPDGMIAYEVQKTSSVLVSQYGNPVELKIEGF